MVVVVGEVLLASTSVSDVGNAGFGVGVAEGGGEITGGTELDDDEAGAFE